MVLKSIRIRGSDNMHEAIDITVIAGNFRVMLISNWGSVMI